METYQNTINYDHYAKNTALECRQYYYKIESCFSTIYDPQDETTRECIYTIP